MENIFILDIIRGASLIIFICVKYARKFVPCVTTKNLRWQRTSQIIWYFRCIPLPIQTLFNPNPICALWATKSTLSNNSWTFEIDMKNWIRLTYFFGTHSYMTEYPWELNFYMKNGSYFNVLWRKLVHDSNST